MMKFLLLSLVIPLSLVARLNPFEPVDAPASQMETLKPIPVSNVMSEDDGTRTVKIMSEEKVKKAVPKVIIKEKVVKEKLTKEQLAEQCKVVDDNKTKVVVKPKPKPVFKPKTYKLLPFLTISTNKKHIDIKTRKKYKLINYMHLEDSKKIVFDFKGNVITSTKLRKIPHNPYFEYFKIGNHEDKGFFRVVIKTKKKTKKYSVIVKDGMATLKYK